MIRIGVVAFDVLAAHEVGESLKQAGAQPIVILPFFENVTKEYIDKLDGLVFTGKSDTSSDRADYCRPLVSVELEKAFLDTDVPMLGICYGQQFLALLFGGTLESLDKVEKGVVAVDLWTQTGLLKGLNQEEMVFVEHRDIVASLPIDFVVLAYTAETKIAAFKHPTKYAYGIIWHPEKADTVHGKELFENFVGICIRH